MWLTSPNDPLRAEANKAKATQEAKAKAKVMRDEWDILDGLRASAACGGAVSSPEYYQTLSEARGLFLKWKGVDRTRAEQLAHRWCQMLPFIRELAPDANDAIRSASVSFAENKFFPTQRRLT